MSAQAAVDKAYAALRAHPCFDRCVRLLRKGLVDWHASEGIRQAAETLGMDRRAYCEARLAANQFLWSSTSTHDMFTQLHLEAAWLDAMGAEGV